MIQEDKTLDNLLDLNGVKFVVDEYLGLWVKFQARKIKQTHERPHGIKYSLTLHDSDNERIMGFYNAHAINNNNITYDHWRRNSSNEARHYQYENAGKLLEDFWSRVDRILEHLKKEEKCTDTKQ